MKIGAVNTKSIVTSGYRIDPDIHLSEGAAVRKQLHNLPYRLTTVGACSSKVFLGNIFSRIFVKDKAHGVPYLSASDTVLSNLETGRFLAKKQANELSYLMLKKDWILITCSGTLGNVTYTNSTFEDHLATHDLIRVVPNDMNVNKGTLYAFLAGKYGYYQITQSQFGGVVKHINDEQASSIIIPILPEQLQNDVDILIQESAKLREDAVELLKYAECSLKQKAGLKDLTPDDYDYFGQQSANRKLSFFTRSIKDIGTTTINAFNHSEKVRKNILSQLFQKEHLLIKDVLDDRMMFSSTGVEVVEVKAGHGIMLINQSDIFNTTVKGKYVAKKEKYVKDLVNYGEIIIAKIGTLGESETFCRCVFAGEDLESQLLSSAFYRMRTNGKVPSGYLYVWLSSDYGFRLLRSTQFGTKLCYPNPALLYEFPIPIIDKNSMLEIDQLVRDAHTKRHEANIKELKAISMVEQEIEKWNK
jgi:hypothetical protein